MTASIDTVSTALSFSVDDGMKELVANPLHLLRAILREATYLPDLTARKFHTKYAILSFRRHQNGPDTEREGASSLPSKYRTYQMKRARKYLCLLQRANEGYSGPLENVLRMTYARKGRRKRQIVQDLMRTYPAQITSLPVTSPGASWQPSAQFLYLLRRQKKVQPYWTKNKIQPMPVIPEQNKWNKPFPETRARNMLKKWYASQAAMLQAPLAEAEWLNIYRSATAHGADIDKLVSKRRPLGTPGIPDTTDHNYGCPENDIEDIGCTSAQKRAPQLSRKVSMSLGNPHKLTRRFLRRTLQRVVLQTSPTMIADTDTGKIATRWEIGGKAQFQSRAPNVSQTLSMFD